MVARPAARRAAKRAVAADAAVRIARRGQAVDGLLCGQDGLAYRYAHQGEVKGACPIRDGADHEYVLCPAHPAWPLCFTHQGRYLREDFREISGRRR